MLRVKNVDVVFYPHDELSAQAIHELIYADIFLGALPYMPGKGVLRNMVRLCRDLPQQTLRKWFTLEKQHKNIQQDILPVTKSAMYKYLVDDEQ
jgi:hypothetical protein